MPEDTTPNGPKKIIVNDFSGGDPVSPIATPSSTEPVPVAPEPADLADSPATATPTPTDVPKFGELQPKVDAHPLFSGTKEPKPKSPRRWLKRTMAPVIALAVALIALYLVVDAGWIKGYSHLPFHVFKAPVSSTAPVITPAKQTPKTPVTTDPYAGWKTYILKYEKLSFKYPSSWKLTDSSNTKGDSIMLASPGNVDVDIITGAHPPIDLSGETKISSETINFAGKNALLSLWTATQIGSPDTSKVGRVMLTDTSGRQFNALNSPKDTQAGNSLIDIQISFGNNSDNSPITVPVNSLTSNSDYSSAKLIIGSMTY